MHNNDYNNMVMTYAVLHDYGDQQNTLARIKDSETIPHYVVHDHEVLTYAIFANPACQPQEARELLATPLSEDFCRRWLFFYRADSSKLPHVPYVATLLEQQIGLQHDLARLNAPRLAAFSGSWLIMIVLLARGHFWLVVGTIASLLWYWLNTEPGLRHKRQQLQLHAQQLDAIGEQYQQLHAQLDYLPPAASFAQLQTIYQQAAVSLWQETVANVVREYELQEVRTVLEHRHWPAFVVDSWGWLQIPFEPDSTLSQYLCDPSHQALAALQPATEDQSTLFRLTYLQIMVLTDHRLLLGRGYYDRVQDKFIAKHFEAIPYQRLLDLQISQDLLPEHACVQNSLPTTLYQAYFRQPVQIITLNSQEYKPWICAKLTSDKALNHQQHPLETVGLKTDLAQLRRLLTEKLTMQQAN